MFLDIHDFVLVFLSFFSFYSNYFRELDVDDSINRSLCKLCVLNFLEVIESSLQQLIGIDIRPMNIWFQSQGIRLYFNSYADRYSIPS